MQRRHDASRILPWLLLTGLLVTATAATAIGDNNVLPTAPTPPPTPSDTPSPPPGVEPELRPPVPSGAEIAAPPTDHYMPSPPPTPEPTMPPAPLPEGPGDQEPPAAPSLPATPEGRAPPPADNLTEHVPLPSPSPTTETTGPEAKDEPTSPDEAVFEPAGYVYDERPGHGGIPSALVPRIAPEVAVKIGFWTTFLSLATVLLFKGFKGASPLFSRVVGPQAPAHAARMAILNFLAAHPYSGIKLIAEGSGLTRSQCRRHLNILEREGFLRACPTRTGRLFLLASDVRRIGRTATSQAHVALQDPAIRTALSVLGDQPSRLSSILTLISDDMGFSRVGAWKAIVRAEKLGLVTRRRIGRQVWLVPTPNPTE